MLSAIYDHALEGLAALAATLFAWLLSDRAAKREAEHKTLREEFDAHVRESHQGRELLARMSAKLDEHVDREENILWAEIRQDRKQQHDMNTKMTDALTKVGERVATVEAILDERLPKPRRRALKRK